MKIKLTVLEGTVCYTRVGEHRPLKAKLYNQTNAYSKSPSKGNDLFDMWPSGIFNKAALTFTAKSIILYILN